MLDLLVHAYKCNCNVQLSPGYDMVDSLDLLALRELLLLLSINLSGFGYLFV